MYAPALLLHPELNLGRSAGLMAGLGVSSRRYAGELDACSRWSGWLRIWFSGAGRLASRSRGLVSSVAGVAYIAAGVGGRGLVRLGFFPARHRLLGGGHEGEGPNAPPALDIY
jgi:hypothetical protein